VAMRRISVSEERVAFIAGRVLPRWPEVLRAGSVEPTRIGPRWRMLLSIVDDTRVFCSTRHPVGVGANMLIRRSVLQEAGGFPTGMGRNGNSLASGEEACVICTILAEGFDIWYDGTIVVEHKIHSVRLTRPWIEERARQEGVVTLGKIGSSWARAVKAAKAAASLPVLAALRLFDSPEAEYFIRFGHNLGLLGTYLRTDLAGPPKMLAAGLPGDLRSGRRAVQSR
jgi:hypothetical protein